jgi:hypothetical protein
MQELLDSSFATLCNTTSGRTPEAYCSDLASCKLRNVSYEWSTSSHYLILYEMLLAAPLLFRFLEDRIVWSRTPFELTSDII